MKKNPDNRTTALALWKNYQPTRCYDTRVLLNFKGRTLVLNSAIFTSLDSVCDPTLGG